MHCIRSYCIYQTKEEGNAKVHQATDEHTSKALLISLKASCDKYIYNTESHIDSDSSADHRQKGVSSKTSTDRGDGEEKRSNNLSSTSNKNQNSTEEKIEDKTVNAEDNTTAQSYKCISSDDLKRGTTHYILHTE